MLRRLLSVSCIAVLAACLGVFMFSSSAIAAAIDPYIVKYLRVSEPIALEVDKQGETRLFSPEALSRGKQLFEKNCLNCHVGGATLPNPQVSLSLKALAGANPPRDNINSLVAFIRQPMIYDGSEETYFCRQVPESWIPQPLVEDLAAFILSAAQKAPGWGTESF